MVFQLSKVEEQVAECHVFTSYSSYIIMDHFPCDVMYTWKFEYYSADHTGGRGGGSTCFKCITF